MKSLAIIGAGAAGMFCAAALRGAKNLRISILEASGAPLKKVLLSGGGRCNFTNAAIDGGDPKDFYPRGARHMRKPLRAFGCVAAREFFRSIGAESKIEADGRVFPVSDDSRTVAAALEKSAAKCEMRFGFRADSLRPAGDCWEICGQRNGRRETLRADFALVATGGRWQKGLEKSVEALGGKFSDPVPTLFPFDLDRAKDGEWENLSGVSVADARADAYFNQVRNKIIAVPKGNSQYRWMMMNIGYVEIRGIDLGAQATLSPADGFYIDVQANYTYQRAQDFTDPADNDPYAGTYGGQIAYIPWHSGSAVARLTYGTWRLNYSFIYVGERYTSSANIPANHEQPWYTHDLGLAKDFRFARWGLGLALEVNNLLNQQYEVVANYPMPGRNYKLTVKAML